jgi:hypothetical protein
MTSSTIRLIKNKFANIDVNNLIVSIDFKPRYDRLFHCYVFGEEYNPFIEEIKSELEKEYKIRIVSCFCNLFKDSNNFIKHHKDDFDFNFITVSFGGEREFHVKHDVTEEVTVYNLQHGDVMMFPQSINDEYTHAVPKCEKETETRVSILFFHK